MEHKFANKRGISSLQDKEFYHINILLPQMKLFPLNQREGNEKNQRRKINLNKKIITFHDLQTNQLHLEFK
jgi:hypothetical protein